MKKIIAIAAAALLSHQAFAQVQLDVDNHIKVIAINGKEIKQGLLQPLQKQFTLDAGRHVITARYDRLFDLRNQEHDYLKSDSITLTVDLADNQTYQLVMPNQPNNYVAAQEYIKSPSLAVVQNGKIIAQENSTENRAGLLAGLGQTLGGIFGRNDKAVIANQQALAGISQTSTTIPAAIPAAAPAQTSASVPAQVKSNSLDGFMQLWLNASEEEREKIRQWVQK